MAVLTVALLAMAAFAIDIGYMFETRSKLQATADASSLAAVTELPSIADTQNTGVQYGGLNYPGVGTVVASNDVIPGNWDTGSASFSAWVAPYNAVEVTARRAEANGNPLDLFFAPILGRETQDVIATAVAVKGHPRKLATLPIIFSNCEWEKFKDNVNYNWPPTFDYPPSLIQFHGNAEECNANPSGQDMPGGFGWLEESAPCEAEVEAGKWIAIKPGAPATQDCKDVMDSLVGTVVLIPWFIDIRNTGTNAEYLVKDFSAFYLTRYKFPSIHGPKGMPPACTGSINCIEGHFVEAVIPDGDIGGEDRGITIVKLVG